MRRTSRCGCCRGSARPPGSRAAGNASAAGARTRSWLSRSPRASSTVPGCRQSMKQGIMVPLHGTDPQHVQDDLGILRVVSGLTQLHCGHRPCDCPSRWSAPRASVRGRATRSVAPRCRLQADGVRGVDGRSRSPRIRRPQDHRSGRAHRQTGQGPPLRSEPSFFAAASGRAPRSGSRREVLATSIATSTASFDVDFKVVMVGLLSGGFWPNHRKRPDVRPWPPAALREGSAAGHGLFRASLPDVLWIALYAGRHARRRVDSQRQTARTQG